MVRSRLTKWLPTALASDHHRPGSNSRPFSRGSDSTLRPAPEADGTYSNLPEVVGTFVLVENAPMEIRWRSGTIDVVIEPRHGTWYAERRSCGVSCPLASGKDLNRVLWFSKEYMAYDRVYQWDERGRDAASVNESPQDIYKTVPRPEQRVPFRHLLYNHG